MSDISRRDAKKPMEPPNLLETILTFIGSLLLKAIWYLSVISNKFKTTSTSQKNLYDMPIDVVGLIIEKLDYRQQRKLREVSKSLCALVDNQKPACKLIEVVCGKEMVYIRMNGQRKKYIIDYERYNKKPNRFSFAHLDDFKKDAFDDLAATLQNPKLQLEEFSISFFFNSDWEEIEDYYNRLQHVLESLNHQVSVEKVEFCPFNSSTLLTILSCLKPGVLEIISLSGVCGTRDKWRNQPGMEQVVLLEQWKKAKKLELEGCIDRFPMEYATHFKRFRICEFLVDGELALIKDFLSQLDNFEYCTLSNGSFSFYPNFVYEVLGEPVFRSATEKVFHHPISDSDYFFEFKIAKGSDDVKIVKKKRESHF